MLARGVVWMRPGAPVTVIHEPGCEMGTVQFEGSALPPQPPAAPKKAKKAKKEPLQSLRLAGV